jgi:hypothetical protein
MTTPTIKKAAAEDLRAAISENKAEILAVVRGASLRRDPSSCRRPRFTLLA